MKSLLRLLAPGLILLLPQTAAMAAVSVSPISNATVRAEEALNLHFVAVDPDGGSITLTASLPAFATLSPPTSGTGTILTYVALAPHAADVGTHPGSVTATAGETSDTEEFQITVTAADANSPPRVTTPVGVSGTEGDPMEFPVLASDADGDAITSLTATGLPDGATFTPNASFTQGMFNWTPTLHQAGHYDVIFAAGNAQTDSVTMHFVIAQSNLGPVAIAPIDDVTMAEGASLQVAVIASDPDQETIDLTASLPDFATLDAPTSSADAETLQTTITIAPGPGTAGTYSASVTATSGSDTATEPFTITVTGEGQTDSTFDATATIIGKFNPHKKKICFKVKPVDDSFSLLDVSLSSITLSFNGNSIPAVHPTHLASDCDEDEDGDGDDDDGEGDCDECDNDHGDRHGDRGRDHDRRHHDRDRNDHRDASSDDDDDGDCEPDSCTASHIMACFSMDDIRELFAGCSVTDSLAFATIEGELTSGGTFVATIGGKHVDRDKGDKDDGDKPRGRKGKLAVRIYPNPMNPNAAISFTLDEPRRVRVAVYDLAGRLVKTIQEREFPAGENTVSWNGATRSGSRASSGVYFLSVQTANAHEVRHITVVK